MLLLYLTFLYHQRSVRHKKGAHDLQRQGQFLFPSQCIFGALAGIGFGSRGRSPLRERSFYLLPTPEALSFAVWELLLRVNILRHC